MSRSRTERNLHRHEQRPVRPLNVATTEPPSSLPPDLMDKPYPSNTPRPLIATAWAVSLSTHHTTRLSDDPLRYEDGGDRRVTRRDARQLSPTGTADSQTHARTQTAQHELMGEPPRTHLSQRRRDSYSGGWRPLTRANIYAEQRIPRRVQGKEGMVGEGGSNDDDELRQGTPFNSRWPFDERRWQKTAHY